MGNQIYNDTGKVDYVYVEPNYTPHGMTGWICPLCGKGNAPWIQQCPCHLNTYQWTYHDGTVMGPEDTPKWEQ